MHTYIIPSVIFEAHKASQKTMLVAQGFISAVSYQTVFLLWKFENNDYNYVYD